MSLAQSDGNERASGVHLFVDEPPSDLDDLKRLQKKVQQVSADVAAATVAVQLGPSSGSGVIISEDGYVLTAGHVIGGPDREAVLILPSGRRIRGKTLGVDRSADSGLIKILEDGKWPHLKMGRVDDLRAGQWCVATGHPGGFKPGRNPVVRLGRLLSIGEALLTTDCTVIGGDSGGPLVNLDGEVIAIHSRIADPLTANMHVPINIYTEHWDRLVKSEVFTATDVSGPFIGVIGKTNAANCVIDDVYPNAPADEAGIRSGDEIIRFAQQPVDSFTDLARLVRKQSPGDVVSVEVRRLGKIVKLKLSVGSRQEDVR